MNEQRVEVDHIDDSRGTSTGRAGAGVGRAALEILRSVLHTIEQGIILVDCDCKPFYANRRACQILSMPSGDEAAAVVGRDCPPGVFVQCREKRKAITYIDVRLPGEGRRKLLGLEVLYQDQPFMAPFYLVLMHDFSEWKKLDDLRSRFATSLSHCMRTPLTAIRNVHSILSEKAHLEEPERERLLGIGWRNIERLIGQLDELQKVFMVESEEMNVCRTLIRIKYLLKPVFADLERKGSIRGFKLRIPDITSLTGRGRLCDFIIAAIDAYGKWLGEAPYIDCVSSLREDFYSTGGIEKKFKISLRPRMPGRHGEKMESLRDFLSYCEAHRGLVLHRIANALDGEMEICPGNSISLLLPVHPPYDREKDLVHPLHMMTERAELSHGEFNLVSMKMVGVVDGDFRFTRFLESSLCTCICDDGIVSRGEEACSYSIFFTNRSRDEVAGILRDVQDRFARSCRQSGEEIYPSIRWEIRHSRAPSAEHTSPELGLVEELV